MPRETSQTTRNIPDDLTDEERRAIRALHLLAKRWPKTLWLFSANGSLNVMRCGPNGEHVENAGGGMEQACSLDTVRIPNGGGDW